MRPGRLYLVTARRGLVSAVVFGLTMALGYATAWREWLGVWSDTQQSIDLSLVIGYPVAIGLAAWVSVGNRAGGLDRLGHGASRRRWRVAVREFLETAWWLALGWLLNLIAAAVVTSRIATAGRPSLLSALAHLAFLCSAVAMGLWCGRLLPGLLGPPVGVVLGYVVLTAADYIAPMVAGALTPLDWRAMTVQVADPWLQGAMILAWALVTAAVLAAQVGNRRAAHGMVIVAGVVFAPLLYFGENDRSFDPAAAHIECTQTHRAVRVCLPAVKRYLAQPIGEPYAEAAGLLAGYLPAETTLVDDEATGESRAGDRQLAAVVAAEERAGRSVLLLSAFADLSAYATVDREEFLAEFAVLSFPDAPTDRRTEDGALPSAQPGEVLMRWFLEELDVPIDGSAVVGGPILDGTGSSFDAADGPLAWLRGLANEERRAWFAAHRDAIANGTVGWDDFG
ncbi:MAG: hypothetical protein ACRCYU_06220 [Nocardioides sp.]